jgi:hypothetical protein
MIEEAKEYVVSYNARLTTDTSAALTFWSSDIFKADEISANIELQLRDMGIEAKKARFETIGAKSYKTWVFAGTIFKDIVEVETKVVVPQGKASDDSSQGTMKVFRQLVFVGRFDGQLKIIESQLREMK